MSFFINNVAMSHDTVCPALHNGLYHNLAILTFLFSLKKNQNLKLIWWQSDTVQREVAKNFE